MWVEVVRSFDAVNVGERYEADADSPRELSLLRSGFTVRVGSDEPVEEEDGGPGTA